MAVNTFADPENSPGERVFIRHDPDTGEPSYAIVRMLGPEKLKTLQRPFERPVKRKGKPRTWQVPKKDTEAFGHACLDWAFTDLVNYTVRLSDEGAVDFFNAELTAVFKLDQEIVLDGLLTKNIKAFLTDRDTTLSTAVSRAAGLMGEDEGDPDDVERQRDEFLEGNSQTGSTSDSSTPRQTVTSASSQMPVDPVPSVASPRRS